MFDLSAPVPLSFVFITIGAIFAVIGVCIYLINIKTKKLKSSSKSNKPS